MRPALRGFTLIELLIVVSLVTIITGSIIPSFNNYVENQGVKQAQEALKDDLRTVQNKALNGELAQMELDGDKVQYWMVEFVEDEPRYEYFVSVDTSTCSSPGDPKRWSWGFSSILPSGNVIRTPLNCLFISFENGDITWSSNSIITVGPLGGDASSCRRIAVTTDGLIRTDNGSGCAP